MHRPRIWASRSRVRCSTFGGAVKLDDVGRGHGPARSLRGSPTGPRNGAAPEVELDDRMGTGKGCLDVAVALADDVGLGAVAGAELARGSSVANSTGNSSTATLTRSAASSARYGSSAKTTATGSPT
jgi:hypothetical protein